MGSRYSDEQPVNYSSRGSYFDCGYQSVLSSKSLAYDPDKYTSHEYNTSRDSFSFDLPRSGILFLIFVHIIEIRTQ